MTEFTLSEIPRIADGKLFTPKDFFDPHISITEVAEKAGTIPYEILTGISQRVKRVYLHE